MTSSPGRSKKPLVAALLLALVAVVLLFRETSPEGEPAAPAPRGAIPPPVGPVAAPASATTATSAAAGSAAATGATAAATTGTPTSATPALAPERQSRKGRIAGRVVLASGEPAPGVLVRFESSPPVIAPFAVEADARGAFDVELPSRASYHVSASKPGFVPASEDLHCFPGRAHAIDPLVLVPAGSLRGVVRDERGTPVSAFVVARPERGELEAAVRTGPSGTFFVEALPEGEVAVTAHACGFRTRRAGTRVTAGETASLDLDLVRTAMLRGTLRLPSGEPVPLAEVTLYRADAPLARLRTESDGTFACAQLEPGPFTAYAVAPEAPVAARGGGTLELGSETNLDLVAGPAGRIAGVVRGPAGPESVLGVTARLRGGPWSAEFLTDEDGRFAFDALVPGSYDVHVRGDHGFVVKTVPDVPSVGSTPLAIELPRGATLRLRVPRAGGRFVLTSLSQPLASPPCEGPFPGNGQLLALHRLPEGEYHALVVSGTEVGTADVRLQDGATVDVTLELQAAAFLAGTMRYPSGRPVASILVEVLDAHERPLADAPTGPDGTFHVGPLLPGPCVLLARGLRSPFLMGTNDARMDLVIPEGR